MNNISDSTLAGVVIAGVVVIGGIAALVFKKSGNKIPESGNKMPELVPSADNRDVLTEFDKIYPGEKGGSRKNTKKRNTNSKKRR